MVFHAFLQQENSAVVVGPAQEEKAAGCDPAYSNCVAPFSYPQHRRSKKSAPSILSNGRVGQVGKFRNGTLILSPTDIKKINSSRVAK